MPMIVGVVLAVLVGVFAMATGLDRDRAFYPVVTIVIAAYYILFAVLGESHQALWRESLISIAFVIVAVVGFKRSLWMVVIALAAHGIFDYFHRAVVTDPGVPAWWPGFCLGYDVVAAAFLAWSLKSGRVRVAA